MMMMMMRKELKHLWVKARWRPLHCRHRITVTPLPTIIIVILFNIIVIIVITIIVVMTNLLLLIFMSVIANEFSSC